MATKLEGKGGGKALVDGPLKKDPLFPYVKVGLPLFTLFL